MKMKIQQYFYTRFRTSWYLVLPDYRNYETHGRLKYLLKL